MSISDIEYLANERSEVARFTAYIYRSGRLRRAMLDGMISDAKIEGRQFLPCEPRQLPALARGGSLFLGLHFCDWSRSKEGKPSISAICEATAGEGSEKMVIFFKRGDVPVNLIELQNANWRVIEEGKIDRLQLQQSLQYFCQTSNVTGAGRLYSDSGFQARARCGIHLEFETVSVSGAVAGSGNRSQNSLAGTRLMTPHTFRLASVS